MFISNKSILTRLMSLENFLSVKYSSEEYPEHFKGGYGFIPNLDNRLEKIEKQLDELTKVKK